MASIVNCKTVIFDNILTIIPDEPIADNCQYEIRLKDLKSLDGSSVLDSYTCKVVTALTPSYCNVSDIAILVDTFEIPESTVLYYIREASKYADYIMEVYGSSSQASTDASGISFPVREFVKTKAMIDCLTKAYVYKAAGSGIKGKLGEISFENTEKYASSINDLLDDLWRRLKGWEDALKGYELEGRAAPKYGVKAHQASESESATFTDIVDNIDRKLMVGR